MDKTPLSIALVYAAFFLIGLLMSLWVVFYTIKNKKISGKFIGLVKQRFKNQVFLFLPIFLFAIAMILYIAIPQASLFDHLLQIFLILNFGWLLTVFVYSLENWLTIKFDISKLDNMRERRVHTQILFLKRFVLTFIFIFTFAAILLSFPGVKKLGAGILTSAGIVTVILGFAAQKILADWLAGLQIALTQPIRIDDVVVVEGEWGKIEEITLTYVIVKIWDQRRMVLPIRYFIENPFQNWTRRGSDIVTSIFFYVDYMLDVDQLRDEMTRLVKATPLWNNLVAILQVVDTSEKTMKLRMLASAGNSGDAWNLACYLRENMIKFIRIHYPNALPRTRLELETKEIIRSVNEPHV